MKKLKNTILIALVALWGSAILLNCTGHEGIMKTAPVCSIASPYNNDQLVKGNTITISVEFEDAERNVREVRLYIDSAIVALFFNFPYTYDWITGCEKPGSHLIKATVMDEDSLSASDEIIVILVEKNETGTVADNDGNTYRTVKIGDQWWMAENLKTRRYADGSEITIVTSDASWQSLDIDAKAFCYYNYNARGEADLYGALYTWTAAMNGNSTGSGTVQGVCPAGWHLPSDSEWKQLEYFLGMNPYEVDEEGWRGTDEGAQIKDFCSGLWNYSYRETNESGFSALPGGYHDNLNCFGAGNEAYFWTSTPNGNSHAWVRQLNRELKSVYRNNLPRDFGLNVRCAKD